MLSPVDVITSPLTDWLTDMFLGDISFDDLPPEGNKNPFAGNYWLHEKWFLLRVWLNENLHIMAIN